MAKRPVDHSIQDDFLSDETNNEYKKGILDHQFFTELEEDLQQHDETPIYIDQDQGDNIIGSAMEGTATDALTGGINDSGMSEDLTSGYLGHGRRMGGPTGGDVFGAGAGSRSDHEVHSRAEGIDQPILEHGADTGLAERIAAENARLMLNQEMHHD